MRPALYTLVGYGTSENSLNANFVERALCEVQHSPAPLLEGLRRAYTGPGGVG
jgi:hypothetical protein